MRLIALGTSMLLLSAVAGATVAPPIRYTLIHDPNTWPVAGVPFRFSVEVVSSLPGVLDQFAAESEEDPNTGQSYWQEVSVPTQPVMLTPDVPYRFDVEVVGNVLHEPVFVSFAFEGRRTGRTFFLSPYTQGTMQQLETELPKMPASSSEELVAPEPAPQKRRSRHPENRKTRPSDDDLNNAMSKGRNIRCYGQIAVVRNGGATVGVDGVTVRVMDEDWDWDQLLAVDVTDTHGHFDITFWYSDSEDPDIYLEFAARNSQVDVVYANILQPTYEFVTGVYDDFGGTQINFSSRTPSTLEGRIAMYAVNTVTRAWRWNQNRGFGGIDDVDVLFPDGSNASYSSGSEEISLSWARAWNEDVLLHEYGHHWVDHFSGGGGSDYCNNRCDQVDDCNHCVWCQETAGDAWNEGLPNWMAILQVANFAANYSPDPLAFTNPFLSNMESIGNCPSSMGGNNTPDDPRWTENIFAALLLDISDASQDDDPAFTSGVADELSLGSDEILHIADTWVPITPEQFLIAFMSEYPHLKSQLWATAKNNGYETDTAAPGVVTNIFSPSHSISLPSPDATIAFTWNAAPDEMSGISGYSVAMTAAPGNLPDMTAEIGAVTAYTTVGQQPGTYWFSIRARDRAGRWSSSSTWSGPYIVREPTPPDMNAMVKPASWDYQLMPRVNPNAVQSGVSAPTVLVGDANSYLNLVLYNSGEESTQQDIWFHSVMLDGVGVWAPFNGLFAPGINGLSFGYFLNSGPYFVRGGRHMLSAFADHTEGWAEDHENDNRYAKQWCWYSTPSVPPGSMTTRSAPPDPLGGFLSTGPLFSYNCDGLSVQQLLTDRYVAAYIVPSNLTDDYDIRLHDYTQSVHNAFTLLNNHGWSAREPGRIDAVLVDVADHPGTMFWHLGMVNMNDGTGSYEVHFVKSTPLALGAPVVVNIPANKYMTLHDVFIGSGQTGPFTVEVDVDPAAGEVQVAWFDAPFEEGKLLDAANLTATDSSGHAVLHLTANWNAWYALALYRDPIDLVSPKAAPSLDITVKVGVSPADLAPNAPTNWAASIVPSPTALSAPTPAGTPASLAGNAASTFVNAALQNLGPSASGSVAHAQYLDGVQISSQNTVGIAAAAGVEFRGSVAETVRGGRHMLSARIDPAGAVAEVSETNNAAAKQWVWSPLALSTEALGSRSVPPAATGGWTDLEANASAPTGFNCDGLRLPAPTLTASGDGYFHGLAVMSGVATDVDVRLHPFSSGVSSGFDVVVASSGWGVGESDYVLGNFHQLAPASWDVGVVNQTGAEDYHFQQIRSSYLATSPDGSYGPFTMAADHFVDLYEVLLDSGPLSIAVDGEDTVDWGFTLHPAGMPYLSKSAAVPQGLAYLDPAGQIDYVSLNVPAAGSYCLAIWKANVSDLGDKADYSIRFYRGTTETSPELLRTRIASVQPNPFNPRTSIEFTLDRAQRAELTIFDLRGRVVRQLVSGSLSGGPHRETWDGTDDAGHRVSTGVYLLRLVAGSTWDERKLVLVK